MSFQLAQEELLKSCIENFNPSRFGPAIKENILGHFVFSELLRPIAQKQ